MYHVFLKLKWLNDIENKNMCQEILKYHGNVMMYYYILK